jgi:hypothetical protein
MTRVVMPGTDQPEAVSLLPVAHAVPSDVPSGEGYTFIQFRQVNV